MYLRDSDRQDFIAGHLLLKVLAGRALCLPARHVELFQQRPSCGGPHGRPSLPRQPRLQLALAHSEGVVLAALGWGLLGVDCRRRSAGWLRPCSSAQLVSSGEPGRVAPAAALAAVDA